MTAVFDTAGAGAGFTIAYVADSSTHTTITGNKPSNVVDGDLMIAICASLSVANPFTFSPPAGWTAIYTAAYRNGTFCIPTQAWYKVASSEASSYQFTVDSTDKDSSLVIHRVTGANTASPLSGTPTEEHGQYASSPACPTMTTTDDDALGVFLMFASGNNLVAEDANYPSGCTGLYLRRSRVYSACVIHGAAIKTIPSAGATGAQTWTGSLSSNSYSTVVSFAIKPGVTALAPVVMKWQM